MSIEELKAENAYQKEVIAHLKKAPRYYGRFLKFTLIRNALKNDPSLVITSICRIAGASRSGYYAFLRNSNSKYERDRESLKIIQEAFTKSGEKAGVITIDLTLRMKGIIINHKKIARIKRDYGLVTKIRQRNPDKTSGRRSETAHYSL